MNSIRKWFYKPKKTDTTLLAQFYFADEDLNFVAAELDSFDGRKDPERCTMLVNQLRVCQDKVLNVIQKIMDDAIPGQRANRDFRVKFPDDVLQDSLAGQLWFGAECLAAGSSILHREVESASMRPLARALTKNLESLRSILRDQSLRSCTEYSDRIKEALVIFDKLFAEFELSYVSAMVPVKTMKEYDLLQEVTVLFSETVQRALEKSLLTQDMIDYCDPALMFTIPRLAIVCGLLIHPEGPLNPDMEPTSMTEMFRPFQTLLQKIRELLYTLSASELELLERSLCSSEEPEVTTSTAVGTSQSEIFPIDQGFHEGGEGIVPLDLVGLNLSEHSSGSSSPVTPLAVAPDGFNLDQLSPCSTVVEDLLGNLSHSSEGDEGSLNKSESQDSGLQSENVSTSDTMLADCPPAVSHDIEGATGCKVTPGEESKKNEKELEDVKRNKDTVDRCVGKCDKNDDGISKTDGESSVSDERCNDTSETEQEIKKACRELIDEIVINAVHYLEGANARVADKTELAEASGNCSVHSTDETVQILDKVRVSNSKLEKTGVEKSEIEELEDNVKNPEEIKGQASDEVECPFEDDQASTETPGVSRQYSWQYNVQFARPQLSLSDPDASDRQSSESLSSDSTLSEGAAPTTSVTDFVIETLANMKIEENAEERKTEVKSCSSQTEQTMASHRSKSSRSKSSKTSLKLSDSHSKSESGKSKKDSSVSQPAQGSRTHASDQSKVAKSDKIANKHRRKAKKANGKDSVENISCGVGPQSQTGSEHADGSLKKTVTKAVKERRNAGYSSGPSGVLCDCDSDTQCSCLESETSSYNSETNDEEEIALAIKAAESASRNEARARFRSSSDLIHRLFVCIAGVADQLQTNYASDLRHILKCVFEMNTESLPEPDNNNSPQETISEGQTLSSNQLLSNQGQQSPSNETQQLFPSNQSRQQLPSNQDSGHTSPNNQSPPQSHRSSIVQPSSSYRNRPLPSSPRRIFDEPPKWVPDEEVERCTACKTPFTFVRRRHHCRNCGKIFCQKCSSTTVPLPHYGHQKPVRVCHRCFLYQVSHFTVTNDF